jgi:2',3'-cyclic-nucleotide 2'-phosphodiesterase (5'-nucleotidase family)
MVRRFRPAHALILALVAAVCLGLQTSPVHEITILHFNDLHARISAVDGRGGFAHLATLLQEERAAAKASLTLHGGDLVQGTPVSALFQGVPVFEIANHLQIDVNSLGNHEFDYGWRKIADFMKVATFPTISANMVDASGKRFLEPPYVVRDVGGLRVAVVGAMMENLLATTTLERLGPWHAAPLLETLRPLVADAKRQADMVVVLGHLTQIDIQSILQNLTDVAIVVAGHNHSGLDTPMLVDGRIGVNAPAYAVVGRLTLRYNKDTRSVASHDWSRLPVDAGKYPAAPEVQRLVDQWEAKVTAVVDVSIGRATKPVAGRELQTLLERMLVERTGADIGYQNPGGIRDTLPRGQLLARHVWNVMPFDNEVTILSIPGRDLAGLATSDLRGLPIPDAITPDRLYRIATTDFVAQSLADRGKKYQVASQGVLLRDLYIDWIRMKGVIP